MADDSPVSEGTTDNPPTTENRLREHWVHFLVAGIVLIAIVVIVISITRPAGSLALLRDQEYARGVITFIVAVATIALAFIMVIASIFAPKDDVSEDRFQRAREVFVAMMGVLGTIVGFYFGAAGAPDAQLDISPIRVVDAATGVKQVAAHIVGGTAPYTSLSALRR